MKMKEIMKRAHEIARTLEGHYHARLALALKQAWKEARKPKLVLYKVKHQPSGGREWVAEIAGLHPKYKFDRKFENAVQRNWSSSGRTGWTYFALKEGKFYEINEPYAGRYFVKVENGKVIETDAEEVLANIA